MVPFHCCFCFRCYNCAVVGGFRVDVVGSAEIVSAVVVVQSTEVVVVESVGALVVDREVTVLVATELTGIGTCMCKRGTCKCKRELF